MCINTVKLLNVSEPIIVSFIQETIPVYPDLPILFQTWPKICQLTLSSCCSFLFVSLRRGKKGQHFFKIGALDSNWRLVNFLFQSFEVKHSAMGRNNKDIICNFWYKVMKIWAVEASQPFEKMALGTLLPSCQMLPSLCSYVKIHIIPW